MSHVKPPSLPAGHRAPQTCLGANTHKNLPSATFGSSGTKNTRPLKELGTLRHLSGLSLGEVSGPQNRPKHPPLLSLPLQHELPRTSSSCPSAMLCSGGSIWAAGWWLSPFMGLVAPKIGQASQVFAVHGSASNDDYEEVLRGRALK